MYLKPKKGLGQNFLIDENILRKISVACAVGKGDTVLEIGAGRGELTALIAERAGFVYALEIDAALCPALKEALSAYANVKILRQDILRFSLKSGMDKYGNKLKVIGNIPYYITTPIIEHIFKYRGLIASAFLTVQKEFAERITALPGSKEYGSFSCFVRYYSRPQIVFMIKRNSFFPVPKVDSALLRLDLKDGLPLNVKKEKRLFRIIRGAFNQRRKTLRNSLRGIVAAQRLEAFFGQYRIDRNTRPEDLHLEDFINLANS